MDLGLQDRIAIVTGGRGIGRVEALALAGEGCTVAVLSLGGESAEETARQIRERGGRATGLAVDVADAGQVRAAVKTILSTFGRIDILVNNAGATDPALMTRPIVEHRDEDWDLMIDSHLRGAYLCIKHAAPAMVGQGWGRIVNTSTIHGRVGGRSGLAAYGAAKAGIEALTRTVARELGPHGVTVNAIAPAYVATATLETLPDAIREHLRLQIPMGRFGRPEELADLVLFLASERAGFINGTIVDFNGGRQEFFGGPPLLRETGRVRREAWHVKRETWHVVSRLHVSRLTPCALRKERTPC